jgi:L-fuconolactonase
MRSYLNPKAGFVTSAASPVIDAHHHFWRIANPGYEWIAGRYAPIAHDFGPAELAPLLQNAGVDGTVLVQARERWDENEYLLAQAELLSVVRGIVVWADLLAPDCIARLEGLAAHPLVRSVRPVLQGIPDTEWILIDQVVDTLRQLPAMNLCFDALVQPRHLQTIARLADMLPELPIVVDHCAKPTIWGGALPERAWTAEIGELARRPNVYCKFSGLTFEHGPNWTTQSVQPVFDTVLGAFGPHRLMWGSDWPVLDVEGSYSSWKSTVDALISTLSSGERAQILGGTAQQFYGLGTVP